MYLSISSAGPFFAWLMHTICVCVEMGVCVNANKISQLNEKRTKKKINKFWYLLEIFFALDFFLVYQRGGMCAEQSSSTFPLGIQENWILYERMNAHTHTYIQTQPKQYRCHLSIDYVWKLLYSFYRRYHNIKVFLFRYRSKWMALPLNSNFQWIIIIINLFEIYKIRKKHKKSWLHWNFSNTVQYSICI